MTSTESLPVTDAVVVSVAVIVCVPSVFSVNWTVFSPWLGVENVALEGRTAPPSELVNATVPV